MGPQQFVDWLSTLGPYVAAGCLTISNAFLYVLYRVERKERLESQKRERNLLPTVLRAINVVREIGMSRYRGRMPRAEEYEPEDIEDDSSG